jgi:hypothetical protein
MRFLIDAKHGNKDVNKLNVFRKYLATSALLVCVK